MIWVAVMMSDLRLMVQWMLSVEVALSAKSGTASSSQLASFALGLPYLNSVLLVLYSTVLSAGPIAVQGQ